MQLAPLATPLGPQPSPETTSAAPPPERLRNALANARTSSDKRYRLRIRVESVRDGENRGGLCRRARRGRFELLCQSSAVLSGVR